MVSLYMRQVSQQLRKNATKEENYLWYEFLRTYPVQFRRQVPFGHVVVDFYCASANLVLELDGSQHFEPRLMPPSGSIRASPHPPPAGAPSPLWGEGWAEPRKGIQL